MYKCLSGPSGTTFILKTFGGNIDVFHQVAKNGHIEVLEWADMKDMQWYHQQMLDDAAARTNLDVLFFFSQRNHTSST
jgi:hypothetical protein